MTRALSPTQDHLDEGEGHEGQQQQGGNNDAAAAGSAGQRRWACTADHHHRLATVKAAELLLSRHLALEAAAAAAAAAPALQADVAHDGLGARDDWWRAAAIVVQAALARGARAREFVGAATAAAPIRHAASCALQ